MYDIWLGFCFGFGVLLMGSVNCVLMGGIDGLGCVCYYDVVDVGFDCVWYVYVNDLGLCGSLLYCVCVY